jgi:hypothetical protein
MSEEVTPEEKAAQEEAIARAEWRAGPGKTAPKWEHAVREAGGGWGDRITWVEGAVVKLFAQEDGRQLYSELRGEILKEQASRQPIRPFGADR